jgi:YidC/Oxa1 family membrane protein insertase
LLPIIATGLMIVQQKMMAPPATSPEQEAQMKMMKYMMVFMGLMFYKVAAGLCLYFIATSLWGFAERRLLPKKKKDGDNQPEATGERPPSRWSRLFGTRPRGDNNNVPPAAPAPDGAARTEPTPGSASKRKNKKQRRRERERDRNRRPEDAAPPSDGGGQEQKERQGFWQGMRAKSGRVASKVRRWWAEVLRKAEKR